MASLAKLGASGGAEPAQGKDGAEPAGAAPARPLTWSEVETLDILNGAETMRDIAASREDMKAGRVVVWKPRDAKSTRSTWPNCARDCKKAPRRMIAACANLSSLNWARHRRAGNRPAGAWNTQRRQRARIMEGGGASRPGIVDRRREARAQGPGSSTAKPVAVCPGRPRHRVHAGAAIPPSGARAGPAPPARRRSGPEGVCAAPAGSAGRTPPRARNEKWRGG